MNTTDGQKTNLIAYLKAEKARVVEERKANLELREKVDLAYNEAKVALSVSMFEMTMAMKDAGIPWELVWSGEGTVVLRNTSVLTYSRKPCPKTQSTLQGITATAPATSTSTLPSPGSE
jgi:hypothetical protein